MGRGVSAGALYLLFDFMCAQRRLRSSCASAQSDQSAQGTSKVTKDPKRIQVKQRRLRHPVRMRKLIRIFSGRAHAILKEMLCASGHLFYIDVFTYSTETNYLAGPLTIF